MRRSSALLATAALAAIGFRALWWEPRHVRLTRRTLRLPHWPQALAGLRVAVIADLHAGVPPVTLASVARVVARLNCERPDLVALLGDYADANAPRRRAVDPRDLVRALGGLSAELGVVAVLGNHDWATGGRATATALRATGIPVLENEALAVGRGLWVAGVADAAKRDARVSDALQSVPDGAAVLLLSHHPDVFPCVPRRVALTLAGHTHGAQVDLPVLRDWVTPSRFGARYAGGVFREGGRVMFVSRGVGTSRLPVRFLAPPEVAVLELQPA